MFVRSDARHSSLELSSEHLDIGDNVDNDHDVTIFDSVTEIIQLDEDMMEISDHESAQLSSVSVDGSDSDSGSTSDLSDDEKEENLQDSDWFFVPLALDQADEVCIKLNDLIKRGLISRDRIMFYNLAYS